jgi:hypothetical protein
MAALTADHLAPPQSWLQGLANVPQNANVRISDRFMRRPDARLFAGERHRQREWVVYAKRPFAGPQQVLDYAGRYTHRVAISNDRLRSIDRPFQIRPSRRVAAATTLRFAIRTSRWVGTHWERWFQI